MARIEVTQECIDKGMRKACWSCPVARAISNVVRHSIIPDVTENRIKFYDYKAPKCLLTLDTPSIVESFITLFDHGDPVSSFSFDLPIPDEFLREPQA